MNQKLIFAFLLVVFAIALVELPDATAHPHHLPAYPKKNAKHPAPKPTQHAAPVKPETKPTSKILKYYCDQPPCHK